MCLRYPVRPTFSDRPSTVAPVLRVSEHGTLQSSTAEEATYRKLLRDGEVEEGEAGEKQKTHRMGSHEERREQMGDCGRGGGVR